MMTSRAIRPLPLRRRTTGGGSGRPARGNILILKSSTAPTPTASPPAAMRSDAAWNGGFHLLHSDQLRKVDRFQQKLVSCPSDFEKYDLCSTVIEDFYRRSCFGAREGLELEVAAYERVMRTSCKKYRKHWETVCYGGPPPDLRFYNFLLVAEKGTDIITLRIADQDKLAMRWGWDKVRHYGWAASPDKKFWHYFSLAAKRILDWDELVTKANRILLRRYQLTPTAARHNIARSPSPLECEDFTLLSGWSFKGPYFTKHDLEGIILPFKKVSDEELPRGFGFDKHGFLVREEYAYDDDDGSSISDDSLFTPTSDEQAGCVADSIIVAMPEGQSAQLRLTPSPTTSDEAEAVVANYSAEKAAEPINAALPVRRYSPPRVLQSQRTFNDNTGGRNVPDWILMPPPPRPCVCPPGMLQDILDILDDPGLWRTRHGLVEDFDEDHPDRFCAAHATKLRNMRKTRASGAFKTAAQRQGDEAADTSTARRRSDEAANANPTRGWSDEAHSIDKEAPHPKRPRFGEPDLSARGPTEAPLPGRRQGDQVRDDAYRGQVLRELEAKIMQQKLIPGTQGAQTDKIVYKILLRSEPPTTGGDSEPIEARFLTGDEARSAVESGSLDIPIFTRGQQEFQWGKSDRPIAKLFRRMASHGFVHVQMPSRSTALDTAAVLSLSDVQERFLEARYRDDPWAVLDLPSPLPNRLLPTFLWGDNCQLLQDVRDAGSTVSVTEPPSPTWHEWVDLRERFLLMEGGYNIAPRMEIHGFSTWITVQEGELGFGWMTHPTPEERWAFIADNLGAAGCWRYVVLRPGDTVFIPPGTAHFVFRTRYKQTLVVTGPIMQWSTGTWKHWKNVTEDRLRSGIMPMDDVRSNVPRFATVVRCLRRSRGWSEEDAPDGQAAVEVPPTLKQVSGCCLFFLERLANLTNPSEIQR